MKISAADLFKLAGHSQEIGFLTETLGEQAFDKNLQLSRSDLDNVVKLMRLKQEHFFSVMQNASKNDKNIWGEPVKNLAAKEFDEMTNRMYSLNCSIRSWRQMGIVDWPTDPHDEDLVMPQ